MLQFQFPTVKLQSGGIIIMAVGKNSRLSSPNWQVFAINKSRSQPSLSPPRFLEHSPCRRRPYFKRC